jgi:transcriptional regulator with XRE-family HTH domain
MSTEILLNRREYIKYQLRLKNSSLAEIGRELGITPASVSQVCSGERSSKRVLKAIADKLEIPIEVLIGKFKKEI